MTARDLDAAGVDLELDVDTARHRDSVDATARLDTHVHGFECKFLWDVHGLSPYFYLRKLMLDVHDGYVNGPIEFDVDGETWVLERAYYPEGKSGLQCPSEWQIQSIYEWWFKCHRKDEREVKATYHLAPTWQGATSKNGKDASPPKAIDEGVRVDCDGSNVQEVKQYLRIWQALYELLGGANRSYFRPRDVHRFSTILQCERYVRVRRDVAKERIIGLEGTIKRIADLLSSGKSERGEYKWDDEQVEGYYHHTKIDRTGAAALIQGHRFGKRLKHYHPKYEHKDETNPLYHPKIEVPFSKNMNDGNGVSWDEREELLRELDEFLINVLHWSKLPTRAIQGIFIPDWYWSISESDREIALYDDPTPEIQLSQDALVMRHFVREHTLPSTVDIFRAIADGGQKHVREVAEESGKSERTVYRFLQRMGELVESHNGAVDWKSEYLRKKIRETIQAADAAAERYQYQAVDAINREAAREASVFQRWVSKYAIEWEDRPDGPAFTVAIGQYTEGEIRKIIRSGLEAWSAAGKRRDRFVDQGRFTWVDEHGDRRQAFATGRFGEQLRILGKRLEHVETDPFL